MDPRYPAMFLTLLLLVGCGPSDESMPTDAGGNTTETQADDQPPEFRSIQIAIQGSFSSTVDLTTGDAARILPVSAPAEFEVLAGDNETAREDLRVEAVGPEGEPLESSDESFRNGIWRFTVELAPGDAVGVRVTDEAGNATTNENTLTIATRAGALVATWERRFFTNDEEPEIRETYERTLTDEGEWTEDRNDFEVGGTYRIEGETLITQKTYQTGGDEQDSNRDTVEFDRAGPFYVDRRFFSPKPWARQDGSGNGVTGTWTRSFERYRHDGGSRERADTVQETLEFTETSGGPNEWTLTREVMPDGSADASTETRSGTWETTELTSIYGDNFGTFLVRTTEKRNGNELDSAETKTELYRTPLDTLLISPFVRTSALEE